MSYLNAYRRKTLSNGRTDKERYEALGRKSFKDMLENKKSPTVHTVRVNINHKDRYYMEEKTLNCEINNVTFNDQAKYDEKYIHFDVNEEVLYGSYVNWKNDNWLILFEENMPFEIYNKYVMRRCNNVFKFKHDGKIHYIPQIVKNLTLYSDGLDEEIYISKPDAQRQILMPDNQLTANITVGTRVMLTGSTVYIITHVDDFSSVGVKAMICKQTPLHSLDDLENNMAYNEEEVSLTENSSGSVDILGLDEVYISDFAKFEIQVPTMLPYKWKLSNNFAQIIDCNETSCSIVVTDDLDLANKEFDLELYLSGTKIANKKITIRGLI